MKALITGSAGQVGRALLASAPGGVQTAAFSRSALDIADPAAIQRVIESEAPAVVINTAAYTAVDRAESEPEQAFQVNASAVAAIAESCSNHGIKLVHLSTDFVFDGLSSLPYRPQDRTAPQSAYGRSKLAGETAALADPRNLVIRTAWVYGNHGQNFVKTMLRLMSQKDELRVVADQVGTPSYALSLAQAVWALIGYGASGLHHFTDAGVASWYDFAVAIQEEALELGLLTREIPVIPIATADYPTPAKRPAYSVLDKAESWATIGKPARHWRAELRHMLAAEKDLHG
jgi:dTDP-4-dehydrorhamnose reductase